MAESACACAQSHDPFASSTLDDLALQACDDADTLNEVLRAYTALEKLVDTSALNDSEALTPSRTELSALLGLLNGALLARIDTVNGATSAVREALRQNTGSAQ
ncbi:hypothetical protein [Variovorax sp. Root434]|uniref:hypothetical protein n=1 Tax=Variovorax sp. Root434 TaxID=1736536 RepID=UPI0006FA2477|nr:hypothetical protein [Variovorax sp. Root434]KQX22251.1 hypothetical protein ASD05_15010 [Variovorax sp. Root434]